MHIIRNVKYCSSRVLRSGRAYLIWHNDILWGQSIAVSSFNAQMCYCLLLYAICYMLYAGGGRSAPPAGRFRPGGAASVPLRPRATRVIPTPRRPFQLYAIMKDRPKGDRHGLSRRSRHASLPTHRGRSSSQSVQNCLGESSGGAVLAGVGRSRSTQFRWKSLPEGPLPGARRRGVWLWTEAGRLWAAYSAPAEE